MNYTRPYFLTDATSNALNNEFVDTQYGIGKNYNIEKLDINIYRIYINVAGLVREEINILLERNMLTVYGKSGYYNRNNSKYLYKSMSFEFNNSFKIPEGAVVEGAYLNNGILEIDIRTLAKTVSNLIRIPIK